MVPTARSDQGNHSDGLKTRLGGGGGAEKSPPLACCRVGSSITPATKRALSMSRHSIPPMIKTIPTAQKKARQRVAGRIIENLAQSRECLGLQNATYRVDRTNPSLAIGNFLGIPDGPIVGFVQWAQSLAVSIFRIYPSVSGGHVEKIKGKRLHWYGFPRLRDLPNCCDLHGGSLRWGLGLRAKNLAPFRSCANHVAQKTSLSFLCGCCVHGWAGF